MFGWATGQPRGGPAAAAGGEHAAGGADQGAHGSFTRDLQGSRRRLQGGGCHPCARLFRRGNTLLCEAPLTGLTLV